MKTNKVKSYIQRLIRVLYPEVSFLVMNVKVYLNYYDEPTYFVLVMLGKKTKKEIEKSHFESHRNSYLYRRYKEVKSKSEILLDVSQTLTNWTQTKITITDDIRLFNQLEEDNIY
jgi:hypothetical protein